MSLINADGLQRVISRGRVGYFFRGGVNEAAGTNLGNDRVAAVICDGVTPLSRISCHKFLGAGLFWGEFVGFEVRDIWSRLFCAIAMPCSAALRYHCTA